MPANMKKAKIKYGKGGSTGKKGKIIPRGGSYMKKGGAVKTVKGVPTKGLTTRQATTLKKHSIHHTKKHIKAMVDAMKKGATFTASHKMAQRKVGK